MKQLFLSILILFSMGACAQKADSITAKHDTLVIDHRTDTFRVASMYLEGTVVHYSDQLRVIRTGFYSDAWAHEGFWKNYKDSQIMDDKFRPFKQKLIGQPSIIPKQ